MPIASKPCKALRIAPILLFCDIDGVELEAICQSDTTFTLVLFFAGPAVYTIADGINEPLTGQLQGEHILGPYENGNYNITITDEANPDCFQNVSGAQDCTPPPVCDLSAIADAVCLDNDSYELQVQLSGNATYTITDGVNEPLTEQTAGNLVFGPYQNGSYNLLIEDETNENCSLPLTGSNDCFVEPPCDLSITTSTDCVDDDSYNVILTLSGNAAYTLNDGINAPMVDVLAGVYELGPYPNGGYSITAISQNDPTCTETANGIRDCSTPLPCNLSAFANTVCIHPGAYADASLGHSQGKAVNEANNRRLHNLLYDQPGQVGGEERHTKARRKETMFKAAREAAKDGEFIIFPTAPEWQQLIVDAVEKHNNTPHSGLPEIMCPRTGERRHMTPNERAIQLKSDAVKVMDARLLPAFFERGLKVPVTRNGFKLNNEWFGRFDEDLDPYRGRHVMAYAHPDIPGVAYVMELARCVDAYRKAGRNHGEQFAGKKGREKRYRNKFNAIIKTALEEGSNLILDRTHVTADPVPERTRETVAPEALVQRAETQRAANEARREKRARDRARFNLEDEPDSDVSRTRDILSRPPTRSLSQQAESAREQIGALQADMEEPDPFEL